MSAFIIGQLNSINSVMGDSESKVDYIHRDESTLEPDPDFLIVLHHNCMSSRLLFQFYRASSIKSQRENNSFKNKKIDRLRKVLIEIRNFFWVFKVLFDITFFTNLNFEIFVFKFQISYLWIAKFVVYKMESNWLRLNNRLTLKVEIVYH